MPIHFIKKKPEAGQLQHLAHSKAVATLCCLQTDTPNAAPPAVASTSAFQSKPDGAGRKHSFVKSLEHEPDRLLGFLLAYAATVSSKPGKIIF